MAIAIFRIQVKADPHGQYLNLTVIILGIILFGQWRAAVSIGNRADYRLQTAFS